MASSDYRDMAKQFLDLWQGQMSRAMTDQQFVRTMLEAMQNMQAQNMAQFTQGMSDAAQPHYTARSRRPSYRHPAAAPESGDGELAELERRLAACEARLAFLESGGGSRSATRQQAAPETVQKRKRTRRSSEEVAAAKRSKSKPVSRKPR